MRDSLVDKILNIYRIKPTKIESAQSGYRNKSYQIIIKGRPSLNLIIYKNEPDILKKIKAADSVSDYLNKKGFPTRLNISNKILSIRYLNTIKYAAIYNYLPGKTIPWEAYSMEHIKLLGQMMSDMHKCLRTLEIYTDSNNSFNVVNNHKQLLNYINKYFVNNGVKNAISQKLGLIINFNMIDNLILFLDKLAQLNNFQVLHMDMVRGNVLFDNSSQKHLHNKLFISGVLDFEKTSYGPVIFDIARTLAFLIIDCKYKTENKIRKYFLISGYNKRGKNNFRDQFFTTPIGLVSSLNTLINLFMFHDFYKFLLNNPYEYLHLNEHYIRTRDYLIKQQYLNKV